MRTAILNSLALHLKHLRGLVADLSDQQMTTELPEAVNHPAWIIGHVVFSCQAMGGEIGLEPWLPENWGILFGTGSKPGGDEHSFPSKEALLEALAKAEDTLASRLNSMSEKSLLEPLPDEECRELLPTVGHALVHILSGHTGLHIGQLTVWRRAMGLPRVCEPFEKPENGDV